MLTLSLTVWHGLDADREHLTWLCCEYCSPALKRATSRWNAPLQRWEQSDTSHIRWWIHKNTYLTTNKFIDFALQVWTCQTCRSFCACSCDAARTSSPLIDRIWSPSNNLPSESATPPLMISDTKMPVSLLLGENRGQTRCLLHTYRINYASCRPAVSQSVTLDCANTLSCMKICT